MFDATPLLRLYARWRLSRLARQSPARTQEQLLLRLARRARDTRFGREHDFAGVNSVADFQARVAIGSYQTFWERYWSGTFPRLTNLTWPGTIPYFAETSGTTTGRSKHIPISHAMLRQFRKVALDLLVFHLANRPESRVLGGRLFMLGGSTALTELAPGIRSAFISGIAAADAPWWIEPYRFPPRAMAAIEDWDRKIDALAPRSLDADIRLLGGMTSWLLLFLERVAAGRPGAGHRLVDWYPGLELLVVGGMALAPYRSRLEGLLEGGEAELREVYPASEGFIAVADRGVDDGLRLALDAGLFFEFVPVEELGAERPTRHWIADVETGRDYAILLSSCAGLWSYQLGDTVRFVALDPPRLVVTGRTSYHLSSFGEHLIGEEIEQAVAAAAQAIGRHVADFAVGPVFPEEHAGVGRHLYVVELSGGPTETAAASAFARRVDERLTDGNLSYATRRAGNVGLEAPEVIMLAPGSFAEWMRRRRKLGGQNKVPRIINDPDLFRFLQRFADERRLPAPGPHGAR